MTGYWKGRGMRAYGLALTLVAACTPASLVDVQAISTVVDPSQVATATGALQLTNFALANFSVAVGGNSSCATNMVCAVGLLTDELAEAQATGLSGRSASTPGAQGSGIYGQLYQTLHWPRTEAQQARQALRLYAPMVSPAVRGRMFAVEGYAVLWFAEAFCLGIPLTAVPLVGPATPTGGFSTPELFERAIALFDSAIAVGADSASVVNLARVGKGRALLGLGRPADAAVAVQGVPTDFVSLAVFSTTSTTDYNNALGRTAPISTYRAEDREGGNGLAWSADPRTAIVTRPSVTGAMLRPAKYYITAAGIPEPSTVALANPIRVADGLEARLIEAEAALAVGNASWLTTLNTLRATCVETAACAPVPGLTAALLPPLADPGTAATRIDLVMKERAMWLYLTGHRLGDLRRLARVYQRNPDTLWPTGIINEPAFPPAYTAPLPSHGKLYGNDMVFLPAASEHTNNPLYGGCIDLNP